MADCNCCTSSSTVACNILFNSEERIRYDELRKELTANLTVEKNPAGYTFIYPNHPLMLLKIAEWISYENRCCPFITFSLHVSGQAEKIRVDLTGNEAVKNLSREEFRLG